MLVVIPDVLTHEELRTIRAGLTPADFSDGKLTSSGRAAAVKKNLQTDVKSPGMSQMQELILRALARNNVFIAVAAPKRLSPPRFNLYKPGMYYGDHVDNAIMGGKFLSRELGDVDEPIRVDMSFTLFISGAAEYDGGELVINSSFGRHPMKLPAGHMVVYPTYYFHQVTPVTRGERLACVGWLQSMIRDGTKREVLLDLAILGQSLTKTAPPSDNDLGLLDKVRKNLLRMWAEN